MPPRPPSALQQFTQNLQTGAAGRRSDQAAALQEVDVATRRLTQSRNRLNRITEELQRNEFATDRQRETALRSQRTELRRLEEAQESYNDAIRRSATVSQNMFRRLREEAVATAAVLGGKAMSYGIGQMNKAYQAMIQTARHTPQTTAEGARQLATATAEYTKMLLSASVTALRYGQSVDEVLDMQHNIVQAFQVDVTRTEFAETVGHLSDTLSYVAARTGHSTSEMQQFSTIAMQTFGRGTLADMQRFDRQFRAITQLPTMMVESLGGLDAELGAVFANREFNEQIREWTTNFGDQATHIGRMATAMATFQKKAVQAGHSIKTMNDMTRAMAQGIMGQHGDSATSLMAGQRLQSQFQQAIQARNQGNSQMWDQLTQTMNASDKRLVEDLSEGNGLQASDLFHMMKTSPEGMKAFMQSLVGVNTGDVSINRRMLAAQGITTGNEQEDLRMAQMIADYGQGNVIDTEEINALFSKALGTEDSEEAARSEAYAAVGAIKLGMEKVPDLLGKAVDYLKELATGGGGGGGGGAIGSFLGSLLGAGGGSAAAGGGLSALAGGSALALGSVGTLAAGSVLWAGHELGAGLTGSDTATSRFLDEAYKLQNRGSNRSYAGGATSAELAQNLGEMWDRTSNITGMYSDEEIGDIFEELHNASGLTNSTQFQSLIDKLKETGAYDDLTDPDSGITSESELQSMLKRIQERERPSQNAIQDVLNNTLQLGRDQARDVIQNTGRRAPVTVPAGTTRPAGTTTPTPAGGRPGAMRGTSPTSMRLDPNGRATATIQIDITNLPEIVAQANVMNAQTAPAGLSVRT